MLDSSRRAALAGFAIALAVGIALFVAIRTKRPSEETRGLAPVGSAAKREAVEVASSKELSAVVSAEPAPHAEPEGEPPTTPAAPPHAEPQLPLDSSDPALEAPELAAASAAGTPFDGSSPESDQGSSCLTYAGHLPTGDRAVDSFGTSLAMSAGRMVVGDQGLEDAMPVRIFEFVGGSWRAVHRIDPCEGRDHPGFGKAVAVSGDRIAIARATCWPIGFDTIEIHLRDEDGNWNSEAVLSSSGAVPAGEAVAKPVNPNTDLFAMRIALDGDRLAAVGAMPGEFTGVRVSLFSRHGSTWQLDATFTPIERRPLYATSIDLSADRLAIGAFAADRFSEGDAGAVFLWRCVDDVWVEEHRWAQSAAHDTGKFGASLQLLPDGLAVGSPAGESTGWGAVYFLSGAGEDWGVKHVLRAPSDLGMFGWSLAVTGDFLAVGAPAAGEGVVLGYLLGEREPIPCGRWVGAGPRLAGFTLAADSGWISVGYGPPPPGSSGRGPGDSSPDAGPLSPALLQLQPPAPR